MINRKVLIITYYWPPSGGVAVQRVLKFSKYLREFNWEPVIYTVSNGEFPEIDSSLLSEIPAGIQVLKTKIWEPYSLYKLFTGKSRREGIHRNTIKSGGKNSLAESVSLWIRGNFFIPDTRCLWITPSVSFLRKRIDKEKFHAIISTGPPHTNHLIAHKLTKITEIPWLADFRDPWTTMDYYKDLKLTRFADRRHHLLESKVLTSAAVVTVVGRFMKTEFESKGAKRVEIITNGFDESDFKNSDARMLDPEFSIVHVGSFLKRRNPIALWETIARLKEENHPLLQNLKIKLIGRVDQSIHESIARYGIDEFFIHIPFTPHSEVVRFLNSAQILLLPIDDFDGAKWVLTGKLFEYMASRRPVLCIGPLDGDAACVIKETGIGETFEFHDRDGLLNYLIRQYNLYLVKKLELEYNSNVNKYSRRELTGRLAQLLNEISL